MSRIHTLLVLCVLAVRAASGQALSGSILGTVTDASGAVVPSGKVTILEINTNQSRSITTNESGNYSFANVPAGRYTVTVEQTGFRKATQEGVEVTINSTVRVDIRLETGQVSEQVTVTASAAELQIAPTPAARWNRGKFRSCH